MRLQNLTSELSLKQFINKPDIGRDLLYDAFDQCLLDGFNLLNLLRLGKKWEMAMLGWKWNRYRTKWLQVLLPNALLQNAHKIVYNWESDRLEGFFQKMFQHCVVNSKRIIVSAILYQLLNHPCLLILTSYQEGFKNVRHN